MKTFSIFATVCCLVVGVTFAFASTQDTQEKSETKPATTQESAEESAEGTAGEDESQFEPIDNMHHFMEYISQPSYRSLKKSFAGEAPENRKGWKSIKSNALILAETSALVADRAPKDSSEEKAAQWRQISFDVYTAGKALYKSSGDFDAAKKHYSVMIESCNKCHQVFDHGKHQLKK